MTEDKRRAIEYGFISKDVWPTLGLGFSQESMKLRKQYSTQNLYSLTVDSVLNERVTKAWEVLIENRKFAKKCLQDYLEFKKTITKENWADEEIKRHYKFYKNCWVSASRDVKSAKADYNFESKRYNYFRLWHSETSRYIKELEDKVLSLENEGLKVPKYTKQDLIHRMGLMSYAQTCEVLIKCYDNLYHWKTAEYQPSNDIFYTNNKFDEIIAKDNIEGIRYDGKEWASRLSQEECDDILKNVTIF